MVSRADAVKHEHAIERKRSRRRRRTTLSALRIADLSRLFHARYGEELPNDDAGRDDVGIMAHHLVSLPGHPIDKITSWASLRAPWLSIGELRAVIDDALRHPRRWKADQLAWRLRLTEADRTALRITTIGAIDRGKGSRLAQRRARNRAARAAARRADGSIPRHEYEAASISCTKPWIAAGVSRATWYRQRRET